MTMRSEDALPKALVSSGQSICEGRPEGEADIHKRADAHVHAWATHLAVVNGQRAQTANADLALTPKRPSEEPATAQTKIKSAQFEAHFTGACIYCPAVSGISRPQRDEPVLARAHITCGQSRMALVLERSSRMSEAPTWVVRWGRNRSRQNHNQTATTGGHSGCSAPQRRPRHASNRYRADRVSGDVFRCAQESFSWGGSISDRR